MNGLFRRDRRGAVLPMAALTMPLILGSVAAAVQYANAVSVKSDMQAAADAASIAMATRKDEAIGRAIFMEKYRQIETPDDALKSLAVKLENGLATVVASAQINTMMGAMGMGDTDVVVEAIAQAGNEASLDVVMALDYSGSMSSGNKYQRMEAAAHTFLDTFEDNDNVRVGLVPFASQTLIQVSGRYLFNTFSGGSLLGDKYLACVSNRGYPNAVSVDTPTEAVEASLWPARDFAVVGSGGNWASEGQPDYGSPPPWQYDSGSDVASYDAGYAITYSGTDDDDGVHTTFVSDPSDFDSDGKHIYSTDAAARKNYSDGRYNYVWGSVMCDYETGWRAGQCGDPPSPPDYAGTSSATTPGSEGFASSDYDAHAAAENLSPECKNLFDRKLMTLPLSNKLDVLKTEISGMSPSGATNIALAFDVAWHVVSDNEPWVEAADNSETEKVLILLTDGVQTVSALGSGDEYSVSAANRNTRESCTAMKAAGVTVYTVAFGVNDTFTKDLLSGCATSLDHYFEPDAGADLEDVFTDIAASLVSPARIVN